MPKKLLNKLENLVNEVKTDINYEIISNFLSWFYEKINIHFNKKIPEKFIPKRWEIYYVNLWINIWSELNKIRPCIIYSQRRFNDWNNIIVIPIKSYKGKLNNFTNVKINPSKLNNLSKISIAVIPNIRDISKKRIKDRIWTIEENYLESIDKKIIRFLGIKKREEE